MTIGRHTFDGPFESVDEISDQPGVFLRLEGGDRGYRVVDVGEARAVRSHLAKHAGAGFGPRPDGGDPVYFAVFYMPRSTAVDRRWVAAEVRDESRGAVP
jgi:hypothetical protein